MARRHRGFNKRRGPSRARGFWTQGARQKRPSFGRLPGHLWDALTPAQQHWIKYKNWYLPPSKEIPRKFWATLSKDTRRWYLKRGAIVVDSLDMEGYEPLDDESQEPLPSTPSTSQQCSATASVPVNSDNSPAAGSASAFASYSSGSQLAKSITGDQKNGPPGPELTSQVHGQWGATGLATSTENNALSQPTETTNGPSEGGANPYEASSKATGHQQNTEIATSRHTPYERRLRAFDLVATICWAIFVLGFLLHKKAHWSPSAIRYQDKDSRQTHSLLHQGVETCQHTGPTPIS